MEKISLKVGLLLCYLLLTACGSGSEDTGTGTGTGFDPSLGLIAYFPFNGNANDESGNGNDGTVTDAVLTIGQDKTGRGAYEFNGTSSFISVPLDINPSVLPQLTMTAWVATFTEDSIKQVISHDNGFFDRSLGIDNRGDGVDYGWSTFSGETAVLGTGPIDLNAWQFIAVVYDQDAGTVNLYVNDTQIEGLGKHGTGETTLRIGSNPVFGEYFYGKIDEVRIYDRALSTTEINALYNL